MWSRWPETGTLSLSSVRHSLAAVPASLPVAWRCNGARVVRAGIVVGHPVWSLVVFSDDAWTFPDGRNIGQCEGPSYDVINWLVVTIVPCSSCTWSHVYCVSPWLVTDACVFKRKWDTKTETGNDPHDQLIVDEMQTEWRNWESLQPRSRLLLRNCKSRALPWASTAELRSNCWAVFKTGKD